MAHQKLEPKNAPILKSGEILETNIDLFEEEKNLILPVFSELTFLGPCVSQTKPVAGATPSAATRLGLFIS
jgi:hypothetical protein